MEMIKSGKFYETINTKLGDMKCYCNSGKEFDQCCELLLLNKKTAETAEQLMRSRYSAFVTANINYLLNSHHKSTRPTKDRKNILKWAKSVVWQRLEVIKAQQGTYTDTEGFVEFKAFYLENGKLECIHENSRFVKEDKLWYYISGTHN